MSISTLLEQAWYRRFSWALLLLPLSWLFRAVVAVRRYYQQKIKPNPSLNVPVIVVGNISVGGTGKTPLLLALVSHLKEQGYRPGVISRGYGGSASEYPMLVSSESIAAEVGDEPLLLASVCPVVVDPDRYRAAKSLLEQTDCDLILSDDGLQHYRLPRDIEIAVVDGERGFGNGQCLPAGPLREPVSRLQCMNFMLTNGRGSNVSLEGSSLFSVEPTQLRHLVTGKQCSPSPSSLDQLSGIGNSHNKVHAVAGIGNPQRFSTTLEQLGFDVQLHAYPDHHDFRGDELQFDDNLPVIITAKDAVKCTDITNDSVWILDVTAKPDTDFLDKLTQAVHNLKESV
jgi:tetraacyldisaccharide 4'-kinase